MTPHANASKTHLLDLLNLLALFNGHGRLVGIGKDPELVVTVVAERVRTSWYAVSGRASNNNGARGRSLHKSMMDSDSTRQKDELAARAAVTSDTACWMER